MGQTKKDNPIRKGWFTKTKPNHYQVTALGMAESEKLERISGAAEVTPKSGQNTYDAVEPYVAHRIFRDFSKDPAEPRTWLGAASFLGITRNDALHLADRITAAESAAKIALLWLDESGQDSIRRGVTGGGVSIRKQDLESLSILIQTLKTRFKIQMDAIRTSSQDASQRSPRRS